MTYYALQVPVIFSFNIFNLVEWLFFRSKWSMLWCYCQSNNCICLILAIKGCASSYTLEEQMEQNQLSPITTPENVKVIIYIYLSIIVLQIFILVLHLFELFERNRNCTLISTMLTHSKNTIEAPGLSCCLNIGITQDLLFDVQNCNTKSLRLVFKV